MIDDNTPTISCPICSEIVYAHMLDRHQEKDHHETLHPTCACTECVAFRYVEYMDTHGISIPPETAYFVAEDHQYD